VGEAADDRVAERRSGWTFGNEVEIENVGSCSTVETIPTGAADQRVVAGSSIQRVIAGPTDNSRCRYLR
jgi:hypothetical protein